MGKPFDIVKVVLRMCALALVVLPIVFVEDFVRHVAYHLSGSITRSVIRQQWPLVVANIVLFAVFMIPLSFRRKVKWSEYSLVGAFFVSLFVEMYGIALCLMFLARLLNWHVRRPERVVRLSVLGVPMGMTLPMAYASVIIVAGMLLVLLGWITLYRSVRRKSFATGGIYAYSRHPQYLGFILIIVGWIVGWTTIPTVILGSIVVYKYWRLCRKEELEMRETVPEYAGYMKATPFMM